MLVTTYILFVTLTVRGDHGHGPALYNYNNHGVDWGEKWSTCATG